MSCPTKWTRQTLAMGLNHSQMRSTWQAASGTLMGFDVAPMLQRGNAIRSYHSYMGVPEAPRRRGGQQTSELQRGSAVVRVMRVFRCTSQGVTPNSASNTART